MIITIKTIEWKEKFHGNHAPINFKLLGGGGERGRHRQGIWTRISFSVQMPGPREVILGQKIANSSPHGHYWHLLVKRVQIPQTHLPPKPTHCNNTTRKRYIHRKKETIQTRLTYFLWTSGRENLHDNDSFQSERPCKPVKIHKSL